MKEYRNTGLASYSICTARPSIPDGSCPKFSGYGFPEMNLARELLLFNDVPMIGWGEICSLAEHMGQEPDHYLKPQPVQMLAAICSAFGNTIWDSLLWANSIAGYEKPMDVGCQLPVKFHLHVFDDMNNGLIAAQKARAMLERYGYHVELHLWGITSDQHKISSLKRESATVFVDVNQALDLFFNNYEKRTV